MAEALALGSSILAFVTITAQLSKIVKDVRDVVKDAPEDIARVVEKISSLECLLNEIHNQDTSTANPRAGNRLTKFWASRSGQLRRDFSLYQAMADKLALQLKKNQGPISSAGIRFHWFFKRATVRELDGMLQENIESTNTVDKGSYITPNHNAGLSPVAQHPSHSIFILHGIGNKSNYRQW